MDFFFGIFIVLAWLFIALMMRLLTTTLHELGHALPALAFTGDEVKVFIGSYGDEADSKQFSLGKLKFYFKAKFFDWNLGMCSHQGKDLSLGKMAIILLGGPLASVLIGALALWYLIENRTNEVIFVIAAAFLLSAVWDFFVNITPYSSAGTTLTGTGLHSDGTLLLMLWQRSRLPQEYLDLEKEYEAKNYRTVVERLEEQVENGTASQPAFFLGIDSYRELGEFGGALSVYEAYQKKFPLRSSDYFTIGKLYDQFGNYREAINCYAEYLHYHYGDLTALHAKGKAYQQLGEHERAVTDLTIVLDQSPGYVPARIDRVLSWLRLQEKEYAAQDLAALAQLAPEAPKYHLYLGFYQEAIGEYAAAHASISKAKELGDDFHGIEYKLNDLEAYF